MAVATAKDQQLLNQIFLTGNKIAEQQGFYETRFRIVINNVQNLDKAPPTYTPTS